MALKVTIGVEFEAFIERLIESGRYSIAGEVVDDALYYFEERERANDAKLELLRAEIQKGIDSGPGIEVDPQAWGEEIKARGLRELAVEEREAKLKALRADIQEGFDSGPPEEIGDMFARIKAEGRHWLAEKNAK